MWQMAAVLFYIGTAPARWRLLLFGKGKLAIVSLVIFSLRQEVLAVGVTLENRMWSQCDSR